MSYLDKLLDGVEVEWKSLREVVGLITTGRLNANAMEANGIYPFFTCNEKPYQINDYAFDLEAILISGNGSQVGHLNYYKGKFNAYQRTYIVGEFRDTVLVMYLFYYLNHTLKGYISKNSRKGSVPYITMPMLESFPIPIPCPENPEKSLAIQKEIVRILDTFTELAAELAARKKQYNYYRDQLLSFGEKDVEWKSLGEIFDLKNGYTPSKSNQEYWTNGTIPWFRMEDIRENGKVLSRSIQYVNTCAIKGGKLFPANSIIVATSATIGEHALITVPFLSNQRFTNLSLKKDYADKFIIKFLFYYGFLLDEWCKNNITVGNFAGVDMVGFKKFQIPIPSIEEQERIVIILDKFDTLTSSISEGLPKEIELRQKQYEYYRDMLLTFPTDNIEV